MLALLVLTKSLAPIPRASLIPRSTLREVWAPPLRSSGQLADAARPGRAEQERAEQEYSGVHILHRPTADGGPHASLLEPLSVASEKDGPREKTGPQAMSGAILERVIEPEELVRRCQAGDQEAFRELFRRHGGDVARLVLRLVGRRGDIEDLVQEVFLQVHRSLKDFRFGSRFSTWLYRVTVNVVLMQRRAARSRPVFVEPPVGFAALDPAASPEDQAARKRRVEAFERLLDRLSDKKRTVYVLHELEGQSPQEIAKIVGAPVLTVRTRLFYARREIAAGLREEPALSALAEHLDAATLAGGTEPRKEPA